MNNHQAYCICCFTPVYSFKRKRVILSNKYQLAIDNETGNTFCASCDYPIGYISMGKHYKYSKTTVTVKTQKI